MRAEGTPFPLRFQTQFTYWEKHFANGTIFYTQRWLINSIFDPNSSGAGGRPRFFDTLLGASGTSTTNTQPYRAYRVNAVRIEVEIYHNADEAVIATINLHRNSGEGPATVIEARSRLNSVSELLSGSGKVAKLSMYAKMTTLFGVADLDDTTFWGGYSSNPSRDYFATVSIGSLDQVTNVDVVTSTRLTFYVDLFDRNTETFAPFAPPAAQAASTEITKQ